MDIFVKKTDKVEVEVFVWTDNDKVTSTSNKEDVPKDKDAQILKFYFRKPNYKDSQTIAKLSMNNGVIDAIVFQESVFRTLLVDWDIKMNDEVIPFNANTIDNLTPDIARSATAGVLEKIAI